LHFKEVFSRWDSAFAEKGWLSVFLANHDQARMVSRFGNDGPNFREVSSKMLSTFIMTMRGTPYYYDGDELGMTNASFEKIEDFRDVQTLNEYRYAQTIGTNLQTTFKRLQFSGRDNGRTPFQWDSSGNAGFTTGIPWIKVAPNYKTINAAAQEKNPNSCLNYFRRLVKLRNENIPVLVYGKYTLLDKANPNVYGYTRKGEGQTMLILLNFSAFTAQANIALNLSSAILLLSNYDEAPLLSKENSKVILKPYQAVIYKL
jgi:oligo-1,6-glucosidase